MTEHEAVERLAKAMEHFTRNSRFGWTWNDLARLALTSHPAVYALRKLLDAQCHADGPDVLGHVMQEARNVLASLPKEK